MNKMNFSEETKQNLNRERYNHPHPLVQRKLEALWLKSQNLPHKDISVLAGISNTTLWRYIRDYQEGGIEKLKEINFCKPKSELHAHKSTIEDYFRKHPPATIKEAMAKIEELTGIKRSEPQVSKFIKSIGLKLRKVGMIPSKADPEKQSIFFEKKLTPRLNEAKSGQRKVFFL